MDLRLTYLDVFSINLRSKRRSLNEKRNIDLGRLESPNVYDWLETARGFTGFISFRISHKGDDWKIIKKKNKDDWMSDEWGGDRDMNRY